MELPVPKGRAKALLVILGSAAVAFTLACLLAPSTSHARSLVLEAGLALVSALAGWSLLVTVTWSGDRKRPALGALLLALGALHVGFFIRDVVRPDDASFGGTGLINLGFLAIAGLVLVALWDELTEHLPVDDRREAMADIFLITAALGGIAFLILQPAEGAEPETVAFAVAAAAPLAWGALAVWAPSRLHTGLVLVMGAMSAAMFGFGFEWLRGTYSGGEAGMQLAFGLGGIGIAGLFTAEASRSHRKQVASRRIRPILTVSAVSAACAGLAFSAAMETSGRAGPLEAAILIAVLASAVAVRILVNQVRTFRATDEVARALEEKDANIREIDMALSRLREVHRSLAASEERLRLLFDVAVDGIVELDGGGVIRRANEAFCTMVGISHDEVIGRTWEEISTEVHGGGPSLQSLPVTGTATLHRNGQELHLAARSSELPGPESGSLLVVRDVSADKVAEMTIRSLFQFLQERDEDRSRLLRRTNAAIEAERNRIARDLHDGPVQGVSAASLSLEAVLLMLRSGDVTGGIDTLAQIRDELAVENDNLRRLMSDLRPPVLEERGLIPALRDSLAKFGKDFGVKTQFKSRALVDIPPDLETLAYRIVQEALTNAAKHAQASELTVAVEAEAGQLRVEVSDDGAGFDPARSREFLRMGRVGLASMRERTELASGTFMVRSRPGGGTTVEATLPLEAAPIRAQHALN
jgi:PAS domain S-box-containing protein